VNSREKKFASTIYARKNKISLTINGQLYKLEIGEEAGKVDPSDTLSFTLRETLGLTGTKESCDSGACGACTVLMDGKAVLSCMQLTVECDGKSIVTIEGLRDPRTGELDKLQQSFIDHTAFQCGFCTPGMIMSAKALLDKNPNPDEQDVRAAIENNLCRCTGYVKIVDAILLAAKRMRQDEAVGHSE